MTQSSKWYIGYQYYAPNGQHGIGRVTLTIDTQSITEPVMLFLEDKIRLTIAGSVSTTIIVIMSMIRLEA